MDKQNGNKRTFNRADILALILAIAKREQADHFTLAGFSMGGRFSVCLGKNLKKQVNHYILLAPAGIGSYDQSSSPTLSTYS